MFTLLLAVQDLSELLGMQNHTLKVKYNVGYCLHQMPLPFFLHCSSLRVPV